MQASYKRFDRNNDTNWFPIDYTSDVESDDLPPDIELDDQPDNVHNEQVMPHMRAVKAKNSSADAVEDEMPDIVESPPVVSKQQTKTKKQEALIEKNRLKDELDIEHALLRMDNESTAGNKKPVYNDPLPGPRKAASVRAPRKTKSSAPTGKDDIEKHQGLLMQIDRYRMSMRFKAALDDAGLRLVGIEDHSIQELEDLIIRIRVIVGNRSNAGGSMLGTGLLTGVSAVENMPVVNHFVHIQGLSNLLSTDEEFMDLCEQLSIDYSIATSLGPEKRLLLLLMKSTAKMHGINNAKYEMMRVMRQQQQSQPAAQNAPQDGQPVPPIVRPRDIDPNVREY